MSGPSADRPRGRSPVELTATLTLILLALVWSWWAIKHGAWFGDVALPGTIVLSLILALLGVFAPWRANLSLSWPVIVALFALAALGIWTLASALWSPSPDIAIVDGQRALTYAVAFLLGLWLANLLAPRFHIAQLPLTIAGAAAGIATIIVLVGDTAPLRALEVDGTLDYPLGYRNANAAFFAVALFPALGLAGNRELDWRLRALALGAATLCADFFLLSQSRGSLIAAGLALLVYLLASPLRLRALAWLALATLPALGIVPALSDLYNAANDDGLRTVADEMEAAGIAAAITAGVAVLLGAIGAWIDARAARLASPTGVANKVVAGGIAAVIAAGLLAFVVAVNDPVDWIGERADEFRTAGSPDLSEESNRFTFNAGSDRWDLWRVAVDDFTDNPLLGDGSGGFQDSYTMNREVAGQDARDAHSVEFEVLAELGAPGLALLLAAFAAAALGAVRARRQGTSAAALSAIALASGVYLLVHASIDWFWAYPALMAPTLALLGSAGAPATFDAQRRPRTVWRPWLVAALAVLALSAVPPWLSSRYVDDAYATWRDDIEHAYTQLDRARTLDPFSDDPLLAEGSIAREVGDRPRAIAAFQRAADKRPEEWATQYLLAELLRRSNHDAAVAHARVARELNPLSEDVRTLVHELARDRGAKARAED
jgi:O-antigen ligase